MTPGVTNAAVQADIERLSEKIDKLNENVQLLALVQKEQATSYSFIAEMAKTHASALYGHNGYAGLVANYLEVAKTVANHDIQINGTPENSEGSLVYIARTLKEKFGAAIKLAWIAIGAAVTSGVVATLNAILKQ